MVHSFAHIQVVATPTSPSRHDDIPVVSTVFLDALMSALSVRSDDSRCLFAITLIYSLVRNEGELLFLRVVVHFLLVSWCVHYDSSFLSCRYPSTTVGSILPHSASQRMFYDTHALYVDLY